MDDQSKPLYLSKTLWINVIAALAAMFYPPANEWVSAHGDTVAGIFAVVNVILRIVTKGALVLW